MLEPSPKYSIDFDLLHKIQDPIISSKLKEINKDYLYWDKVKYIKFEDLSPVQNWNLIKFSRQVNYKKIQFHNTIFNYYVTDHIQKSLHEFDMSIGGNLGGKNLIPDADKTRYLVSSIMEEAISSSIMEGANTTRKKAKEMLRKESKPKNNGEQMILNNYQTIKHILKHRSDDLTPEALLEIHRLMTINTLDKEDEGVYRENNDIYVVNVSTSEIVHLPPDFSEISNYIKQLCEFFNKDHSEFTHPIIKGIIIHFMIGWIHPFVDGNGRTARALFYWYMLKKGYWLTEYLSISRIIQGSKRQYEKAYLYTENDENDLSYFITYNINVMHKAFDALNKYIKAKQRDNIQAAQFLGLSNINERQAQILKILYDEPEVILSVKEIQNQFQVSNFTARADLMGLVQNGYMKSIPVNKVKTNYIRSEKFSSLIK